jgi:hypothetical protein
MDGVHYLMDEPDPPNVDIPKPIIPCQVYNKPTSLSWIKTHQISPEMFRSLRKISARCGMIPKRSEAFGTQGKPYVDGAGSCPVV